MQQLPVNLQYKRTAEFVQAQIAASADTSNVVDLGGMQLRGVLLPSAWTSCDLTFNGAIVSPEYLSYFAYGIDNFDGNNNSPLTITGTTGGRWIPLYAHWFDSIPFLQLVCSTDQTADRTIILALQPVYQGVHG